MDKVRLSSGGVRGGMPLFAVITAVVLVWAGTASAANVIITLYPHCDPQCLNSTFLTSFDRPSPAKLATAELGSPLLSTSTCDDKNFDGWYNSETGGSKITTSTSFTTTAAIHAQYTYTITFDRNGGSLSTTTAKTSTGKTLATLPTPTNSNAAFDGWYLNGTKITTSYVYERHTTLTAMWTYKVTFNANGGSVTPASAQTNTSGILAAGLPEPEKTDAIFNGWYTKATNDGIKINPTTVYTANTTIYAWWIPVFTVTFNANGGTIDPDVETSAKTNPADGTLAALPAAPTRDGYTFDGWYTAATGGTKIPDGYVFQKNTTIYAQWKIINYMITFSNTNPDAGTIADNKRSDMTGAGWKLAKLPALTPKTGYTSGAWYNDETNGNPVTTSTVFSEPTTIYARWTPTSYTISYSGMEGATATPPNPTKYTIEDAVTLSPPKKPANTFIGWTWSGQKEKEPQTSVSIDQGSTGNKAFTANWTVRILNITFQDDDTTFYRETGTSANAGKVASIPTLKTKNGYTFDGWYPDYPEDAAKVTGSTVFDGDATVYSRWTPVSYTISYNLGGGIEDPDYPNPTKYTIESSITLNDPVRPAYIFNGWTWTGHSKPEKDVSIERGSTGNKSFTANWTAVFYKVTFNTNGGGAVTPDSATTVAGGKLASPLPTPAWAGYFFEGWFTDGNAGEKVTASTVYEKETIIYAHWAPIYTIMFNAYGGGLPSFTTAKTGSGSKLDSLPKVKKNDLAFDGWYTDSTGGVKITTSMAFTSDSIAYARWVAGNTVTFSAGANGKLTAVVNGDTITSGALAPKGRSVVFTAKPDAGYEVDVWKTGAAVAGNSAATYTLASLTADTTVTVSFKKINDAVASPDRVIPAADSNRVTAAIAPVAALTAEFTAGPNPVGRSSGAVSFFRNGSRIESAALSVYDAAGNTVAAVKIGKNADAGGNGKRAVGSWDLRDKKGRPVSEGAYLVKGAIKTAGGKREQVSVILSVGH